VITPFGSILIAATVEVAKVADDEVAMYRDELIERNVNGFDVVDVSWSANCGPVDEATVSAELT
jgi:hypothetical protein